MFRRTSSEWTFGVGIVPLQSSSGTDLKAISSTSPNTSLVSTSELSSSSKASKKGQMVNSLPFVFFSFASYFLWEIWSVMTLDEFAQQENSSHRIPGISNGNIWSNGKRPFSFPTALRLGLCRTVEESNCCSPWRFTLSVFWVSRKTRDLHTGVKTLES